MAGRALLYGGPSDGAELRVASEPPPAIFTQGGLVISPLAAKAVDDAQPTVGPPPAEYRFAGDLRRGVRGMYRYDYVPPATPASSEGAG